MKSTIRTRAIAPLAGLVLILATAACGSDDDSSSDSQSTDSSQTEDAPAEDASAEDAPAEDDAAAEDEAAASGGGDYCETLQTMGDDLLSGASATDPDAAAGMVEVYRELAASAPDDVAADWTAMADAMETLSDIDPADPEALDQLNELGDLAAISQRLSESVQSECA